MPLRLCKKWTTSREFVEWIEWLDQEEKRITVNQNYMAQIALEVRRSWIKDKRTLKIKDFILPFQKEGQKKKKKREKMNELSVEERIKKSKSFWFGLCGISGNK